MKKLMFVIACLVLVYFDGYGIWKTTVYNASAECSVLFDSESKLITGFYGRGLYWLGIRSLWEPRQMLRNYSRGSKACEFVAYIPGAFRNDSPYLQVTVPVTVRYHLSDIPKIEYEDCRGDFIALAISRFGSISLNKALIDSKKGGRQLNESEYEASVSASITAALEHFSSAAESYGVTIEDIRVRGNILYPSYFVYEALFSHGESLVKQALSDEIKMREVEEDQRRNLVRNKYYYAHLEKLAAIIEKSPSVLKYIYIDKTGIRGNMTLPYSSSIDLDDLGSEKQRDGGRTSREIDNLK